MSDFNNFDTFVDKPSAGSARLLLEGEYPAKVAEIVNKATKSGNGHYMEIKYVLSEQEAGFVVIDRLNYDNPNETAVKIARDTWQDICIACGYEDACGNPYDILDHNIKLILAIQPERPKDPRVPEGDKWAAQTVVDGYSPF